MSCHRYAALLLLVGSSSLASQGVHVVRPNDNRRSGGTLHGDTLTLALEATTAMWHPDGDRAPGAPVATFAETGGMPQIPGPLVRVRAGTEARVTLVNRLADSLVVHGLHTRAASASRVPPLVLAPGERRSVTFRLDAPGTYHYWGTTTGRRIEFRTLEDAQLTGAIIVDRRDGPPARDRIFVIGMWTDTVGRAGLLRHRVLGVINGRAWPHTERLTHLVGDTVRWRVINASADLHPMHLHGFFFRVDARGNGFVDSVLTRKHDAVTESMGAGATIAMSWIPERPGNWLFHCHVPEHIERRGSLGVPAPRTTHANHATEGMGGLVLGIDVQPRGGAIAASSGSMAERQLRLIVRPKQGSTETHPRYEYVVHERGPEPPVGAIDAPPPTLDVMRGQPVRITVVNRLNEPTAVHWHGIELESYFDGVPGFSGSAGRIAPIIAPSDSFVVRFTPPRAGTYIYHTHAEEIRQQRAGLAGALVVSEPDTPRDPARDIPLVLGEILDRDGRTIRHVVNGRTEPPPLDMRVGTTYRLRFVQISVARSALRLELLRDSTAVEWRPVSKDGAALPAADQQMVPARLRFGIGETYDFEFTPTVPGPMRIEIRQGLSFALPAPLYVTQPIVVR